MSLFTHIRRAFTKARSVEASNTTKGACVKKKEEPEATTNAVSVDFPTLVEQVARCRKEAETVLGAVGGDETLLVRADYQLALMRLFAWLKNPDDSSDLKDIVACVQKLASLKKTAGAEDADGTTGEGEGGLSPEQIADIENDLRLM
jgi:hypothetical protein